MGAMSWVHWVIVLAVVALLFGGRGKLSSIMGDAAKGIRAFKDGLKGEDEVVAETTKPLPREKDETGEPSGEAMAEALAFQLRRLESMREAAAKLMARPQLGINIHGRGAPEGLRVAYNATYKDTLYDLLKAYGDIRRRAEASVYELPVFNVMTMEEAVERMTKMLGNLPKSGPFSVWTTLQSFLPENIKDPLMMRSSLASTLTAGLELAKQGKIEIRQDGLFRPIYLRTANRPAITDEPRIPEEESNDDDTGTN